MKRLVNTIFPYFDTQALDAARFFFGTTAAEVKIREGSINLTDFLEDADAFDQDMNSGQYGERTISEGSRNATMSRFAGRVIKKYGDTDEAYACFLEEAAKCDPPLSGGELKTIWCSAQKFFSRLSSQDGYIPPEVYNDDTSYMPEDFSDVGQAEVLAKHFSGELRYSPATHFIRYTEHYWKNSKYITATLKESHPMLEISPRDLDADCFALCTPAATYDLRRGLAGAREHSPENFITKITAVSPSSKGEQLWLDCLDLIFCHNQELIDYVQMICGLAVIGKVYVEALIIAYGCGRNGKSTFWNAVSRMLGLYSGNISADTLTIGCRRNIKPELAEAKGKKTADRSGDAGRREAQRLHRQTALLHG